MSTNSVAPVMDTKTVLAHAPHQIGKVTLTVRDLEKVTAFYRDVIGLHLLATEPGVTRLGTTTTTLLELRHNPNATIPSPREAGLFHTAFLLPERADLAAWLVFASEKRIALQGASDHDVSEALYLHDPEGNGIEIYVDRPDSAWNVKQNFSMGSNPLDIDDLLDTRAGRVWSGFPEGGTVGHVHLKVGALPEAEAFYSTLLGFDITYRYQGGTFYGSGGYHHQLASNIWNSRGAQMRSANTTGLAEFEIVTEKAALEALRGRLKPEMGTQADGERVVLVDPWGTRVVMVGR